MGKVAANLKIYLFKSLSEEYKKLSKKLKRAALNSKRACENNDLIKTKLRENDVPFVEVQGRVKRLYSLWQKTEKA
jgi:(p)ppGpp synthase/HD superfamily hydrolase